MSALTVEALTDVSVARPGLDALAAITSNHIDLTQEGHLSYSRVWVAHLGSVADPLAYALIWLVADEVQVIDLATRPDYRRKGAARALLSEVLQDARIQHKSAVFLDARASNTAALALYQSVGFELLRVRHRYYANGEDGLEMRCQL